MGSVFGDKIIYMADKNIFSERISVTDWECRMRNVCDRQDLFHQIIQVTD